MGVYDQSIIDTTPGAGGLFSPPANFSGTPDEYVQLIRQRYQDFQYQQLFSFQVRYLKNGGSVEFAGQFTAEAKIILQKLNVHQIKLR